MSIIERVYFELAKQNLKASALSAYVGISHAQLSMWKKRGTDPKPMYIPKIAEFLGVTVEYLLTGELPAESVESSSVDINDRLQEIIDALTGEEGVLWDNEEISEEGRSVLLNWLGHDRDLFDSMRKK